jgi:hypothetical protein
MGSQAPPHPSCDTGGAYHQVTGVHCNPKDWNLYVKPELPYICDAVTGVCRDNDEAFEDRPSGRLYTAESEGNQCGGARQPQCYKQCKIVVDLDPEGDKSWVRTDIWWRNETGSGNSGRNNYPTSNTWLSYYYKSGFIQNANVNYASITGENNKFTHFGSALGYLGNDVVNVRVPVGASTFSPLAAATFYAPGTGDLSVDLSSAHTQLAYIFYRVYNMQWNSASSAYEPSTAGNIYVGTATTRSQNTQAGPDFVPRILTVCGSDVCRDADKVVISGVTVNDAQGDRIDSEKSLFASLKFYYYAHPDHMPVKNIEVNWGDGSAITTIPGKYKNNIPECNVDAPMPGQVATTKQGFGGTERACREAYKTFYHDYQVSALYDSTYDCDTDEVGEPLVDQASCYKPTVRAQDNWGNWSAWTSFAGWVVVTGKNE